MTDYPSIKPEDVREGDVVRWTNDGRRDQPVTMQGTVWLDENGRRWVGPFTFERRPDLRLVSRPTPPEPPLRVGDFVKGRRGHFEGQIVCVTDLADHSPYCVGDYWYESDELRRVEPPVGWPVGVPTIDAPTVWYFKSTSSGKYVWCGDVEIDFSWSELVAAGGVPALAVTR